MTKSVDMSDLSCVFYIKTIISYHLRIQTQLTGDSAGDTRESCCIIHDLFLDTNWAELHSQIQSEEPAKNCTPESGTEAMTWMGK